MKESVCLSLRLEKFFKAAAEATPALEAQYIGMNDGVFREYPASLTDSPIKSYGWCIG